RTYMAFGGGMMGGMGGAAFRKSRAEAQSRVEGRVARSAPTAAQADRAYNKAINAAAYVDNDLIQGIESGKVQLDALKKDDLPDELQSLSADERKKVVAEKIEERRKIRERIVELTKKRDAFIQEERKKQAAAKPAGFDEAVSAALKAQIARRGLKP